MPDTIARLRAEWTLLLNGAELREARMTWSAIDPRFAGDGVPDLLARSGNSVDPTPERNALLAALVDRAKPGRRHARLASRLALQLLLPAALGLIRELRSAVPDAAEREAAVLAGLLECIAAVPRPVDPAKVTVAAYLKVATRRRVYRELQRHGLAALPVSPGAADPHTADSVDPGYTEPGFGLAEAASWLDTARAAALIDDLDARLITATRLHDQPLARVCARHRLSHDTGRRRRARAELVLRAAA